MKLGLVRHFKVNTDEIEGKVGLEEYNNQMFLYDELNVTPTEVDLRGIDWNKCYTSSLPRAVTTAKSIYGGEIEECDLVREVPMNIVKEISGKNDMHSWSMVSLLEWAAGEPGIMPETMEGSRERANKFLDILEEECSQEDNVLVVCHGLIMMVLDKELRKRGYSAEDTAFAANGELYLYEK